MYQKGKRQEALVAALLQVQLVMSSCPAWQNQVRLLKAVTGHLALT